VPSAPIRTSRLLAQLVMVLLRRRALAGWLLLLAFAVALLGLSRLRIDFSSTAFYGDDSVAAARLQAFHDTWGADDDTLLVLIHPLDPDDPAGVLEQGRLSAIADLGVALRSVAEVREASSIADLTLPLPTLGGEPRTTTFVELAQNLKLAAQPIEARQALLERLPIVPALLSADGRDTVIVVELGFSSDDMVRTRAVVTELERVLDEHDAALTKLGLAHELTGVPGIRASFFDLIVRDQAVFVPLTLLLIGLALFAVFRRLHGVVIPALAAVIPTAMLVGIMGWMGEPIGLLNQSYFTLLPVIAVADAIHMIARFHAERRRPEHEHADEFASGLDARGQAIVRACSQVGLACFLTSLTTAAGFASLATATMPILRAFGLYAALGVSLAFVVGLVLVPLSLSLVRDDRLPPPPAAIGVIDWVVARSLRRPLAVVLAAVGLVVLALGPASRVEVDNTLTALLEPEHPVSVASRRVDDRLGGVLGLELEIIATDGADLRTPEPLAALHGFERWLAEQPGVRVVDGLASAVAGVGELRLAGAGAVIPRDQAEIDARLALLAPHAPLDRLVRVDGQRLRIHVGMPDAGGRQFVEFAEHAEAELNLRLAALPQLDAHATGTPLLAYRGVNGITEDLRSSFALVFVVVVAAIGLSFRSMWPALVGILPNLAPLLFGYAALGLLGKVLDPLAAVILTLALGLAVDNTLHVVARTREELQRGVMAGESGESGGIERALHRAIGQSSWAVTVTSLVIVGGLLLNLGSSFPPLQMLGLLGSLVIGLALLANLTVLPASLALLRGRGLINSRPSGART
jgi:predicted RND superfamily exporter protein